MSTIMPNDEEAPTIEASDVPPQQLNKAFNRARQQYQTSTDQHIGNKLSRSKTGAESCKCSLWGGGGDIRLKREIE